MRSQSKSEKISSMKIALSATAITILLNACSASASKEFSYDGRIDDAAVELIKRHTSQGSVLNISSLGGQISSAIELANYVHDNKIQVVLTGACISACAEFILPASESVVFTEKTIIGFHGNQYIFRELYREHDLKSRNGCYSVLSDNADALYEKLGVNTEFWRETYERVAPHSVHILENDSDCGILRYKLTHKFWYPSVPQLESFLQRDVSDIVCNNNLECIAIYMIGSFANSGDSYMLHDKSVTY